MSPVLPLLALSLLSSVMGQNLQCPTGVTNPNTFYIIGASGGDSTVSFRLYTLILQTQITFPFADCL